MLRAAFSKLADFEKAHLPATAWPPTGWYVGWSKGRSVFEVSDGSAAMELRWLAYRRRYPKPWHHELAFAAVSATNFALASFRSLWRSVR